MYCQGINFIDCVLNKVSKSGDPNKVFRVCFDLKSTQFSLEVCKSKVGYFLMCFPSLTFFSCFFISKTEIRIKGRILAKEILIRQKQNLNGINVTLILNFQTKDIVFKNELYIFCY